MSKTKTSKIRASAVIKSFWKETLGIEENAVMLDPIYAEADNMTYNAVFNCDHCHQITMQSITELYYQVQRTCVKCGETTIEQIREVK